MEKLKKVFEVVKKHADKIAHFAVCFAIVLAAGVFRNGWLLLAGVIIAVIISIAKELWDSSASGKFDWIDLAADAIGIVAALIFAGLGALV